MRIMLYGFLTGICLAQAVIKTYLGGPLWLIVLAVAGLILFGSLGYKILRQEFKEVYDE